jgi:hypothetical protein
MRDERFWIFTHEMTRQGLAVRYQDIAADRNPTNPYAGIDGLEELTDLS